MDPWAFRCLLRSLNRCTSERDHFVFYEDLVASPEREASRLFAALGLAWQSSLLEQRPQVAKRVRTQDETWKSSTEAPIAKQETLSLSSEQEADVRDALDAGLYKRLRARVRSKDGTP